MKKRILVTGAAGFIGFHLAEKLAKRGDFVIGYDNFNAYYPPSLKRERAKLLKNLNIDVIEGDICDKTLLDVIEKKEITHLVNLAAQAGVRHSLTHPEHYLKSNIDGFVNVLETCRKANIPLTYASSSSVYGNNQKVPFSIEDRVDNQASLYGVTKRTNELLANTYHHLYGIPVTGLRFFTVYGPWGRPDMAYYKFTKAVLEGTEITIFHEGKLRRDFTYIDDIVNGTVSAIDLEAPCELFNLGHHKPITVLDFVNLLENILGKKAKKQFLPMQPGDVLETFADISHSQQKLGFYPSTPIEKGLKSFVEWYLGRVKGEV